MPENALREGFTPFMAVDRLPPQNIEAEQSVLGSLLIDPEAIVRVGSILKPVDFYRDSHAMIFDSVLDLHERSQPSDFITVSDDLVRRGKLEEVGGASYLTYLINAVPTSIHAEYYAHIVERTAVLRRLIEAAAQISGLAYEAADDVDDVVDRAEQILFGISERRISRDLIPIRQLLSAYFERIEYLSQHQGDILGVPTGLPDLDKLLGGFQRSDLIILAGRPSVGKTSLALSMALGAAKKYHQKIAIFSLEMSCEQLVQRLVSSETGIDTQRLRLGQIEEYEWPKFVQATGLLSDLSVFIDDTPSLPVLEMRTKVRRLASEHGVDLVIVDYLQLMRGSVGHSDNRVQEVSEISRGLKALGRELNIPVLALSQLSRAVESRQDKHPILSDLRESGSIEQDADIVLFVYRDDMYNENSDMENIAELHIAKHRNGPTGKVHLYFKKELAQFHPVQFQREEL
jgi:replicative DNA helicase